MTRLYIDICWVVSHHKWFFLQNPEMTCYINELKSHTMYSKLMRTYKMEDSKLLSYVCAFSGDWQLLEQHLKSGNTYSAFVRPI